MIDIIIPVYNTPISDLKRCLNSILEQSYKNYKVYIIDDGSSESIKKFLDDYTKDKSNFVVKHILNGGVSTARNIGIEISNSEYITFVDSDDTIEKDFLKEAYQLIKENDLDIIIGGYNEILNNKINKIRKCHDGLHIYNKNNINLFFDKLLSTKIRNDNIEIDSSPIGRIYTRLYKKSVIGKIRFNKDIHISEDTLFMIDLMDSINKIGLVPNIWYNYYQNDYSIMHSNNNEKLINDMLLFLKEIYQRMVNENNLELKNAYKMRIFKTVLNMLDIIEKNNNLELKNKLLSQKIIKEGLKEINMNNYINIRDKELKILKFLINL